MRLFWLRHPVREWECAGRGTRPHVAIIRRVSPLEPAVEGCHGLRISIVPEGVNPCPIVYNSTPEMGVLARSINQ